MTGLMVHYLYRRKSSLGTKSEQNSACRDAIDFFPASVHRCFSSGRIRSVPQQTVNFLLSAPSHEHSIFDQQPIARPASPYKDSKRCLKYTSQISSMSSKRPAEDGASEPKPKKHRPGFKVGPDNLPDGVHRRKGISFPPDSQVSAVENETYTNAI